MTKVQLSEIAKELFEKDFIVFAGTGVTNGYDFPDWQKLLKKLLEDSDIKDHFDIDFEKYPSEKYPDLAEEIYENFNKKSLAYKYENIINDALIPKQVPYTTQQSKIIKTAKWIITTNFENSFENALKEMYTLNDLDKDKFPIYALPDFPTSDLQKEKHTLIYLHGLAKEKYIIFRKSQYEAYYKENGATNLIDFLKAVYKKYTLVFIGFSFDDIYFKNAIINVYKETERSEAINCQKLGYISILNNIKHYCFLPKSKNKIKNELEDIKIKVIESDEHIDWFTCFQLLDILRNENKLI